ncbi:hypothetical protein E3J79_04190 [Candidatus Dependentiae bacterium]|nr:MAG: hypothetical protein E3J79_04190 [Candidatus Dependentiae bacterium]
MKRSQIVAIINAGILLSTTCIGQEKEKLPTLDDCHRLIVGAHTRAFSKENLLSTRVKPDEKKKWDEMMSEIKEYIARNDPQLMTKFNKISKVSNNLFTVLEQNYKKNILGNLPPYYYPSIEKILNQFNFKKELKEIQKIHKDLKKKPLLFKEPKKIADARQLLYLLTLYIEATIGKVFNDLEKFKRLKK